ncbi:hypothetical protein IRZ83_12875 [Flavobacterium sp. JLP]|uniref:hypothetical protein n=1 Tax=unclassified Flavobacterium TaxID=196869 RepID=UPI00188BDCF6|nr:MULTISPECIES: hypothetical protein [unclassified Flavobacterium]MBF4493301.1 hypothetical protein [Flavobacterium sp. MR2016-29]MBF4507563.1 hypothetical protein [Flavobacterium sp. JLP]
MTKIRIGDLVSLKNHPFGIDADNVKISAFAGMTPPILVVSEIMNSITEFDGDTGEEKPKQVKCIFYSHKSHKFENYWFNVKQLKIISKFEDDDEDEEKNVVVSKKGEFNTALDSSLSDVGIEYPKSNILSELKKDFLNRQVILKSCDHELGKIKSTFSKVDNKSSQKLNSHLDFLPPVLTVIDVKLNDEKISFNTKSGNQKKIISYFLLKCKWYNPSSGGFSEDFIPIETVLLVQEVKSLELISQFILDKLFLRQNLENQIVLESGVVIDHSYFQPIEIIFNHYYYKLKYYDFFKNRFNEIDLSKIDLDEETVELSDFITEKIPEYKKQLEEFSSVKEFDFIVGNYYRITYKDLQEKITRRIILVKEFIKDKVIIADCLLRDGEERHFRLDGGILKIEVLDSKFFI